MKPRPLNPLEREVIQWLLDKARTPAGRGYPDVPDNLRVVGHCDCGCVSGYFEHERAGAEIVADAVAK
jgi:hypothetical protein